MSSLSKRIKSISQWEKDLVNGYTKEAQKLVVPNQIPVAISYLCLVYYYQYDYFVDSTQGSTRTKTSVQATKKKIAKLYGHQTMYSFINKELNQIPMILRWTFRINKIDNTNNDDMDACYIGITTATTPDNIFKCEKWCYKLSNKGDLIIGGFPKYPYCKPFGFDDKIVMEYNNKTKEFKFAINGQCPGIAFSISTENMKETRQYKIAAEIQAGNQIDLICFQKIKL